VFPLDFGKVANCYKSFPMNPSTCNRRGDDPWLMFADTRAPVFANQAAYGFSSPILVAYGLAQLVGGVLLAFRKTRFVGAAIVAVTFLISLVILIIDGNVSVSVATIVATLLLGVVMKQNWSIAH